MRRLLLPMLLATAIAPARSSAQAPAVDRAESAWPRSTPQAQGLDPKPLEQMVNRIKANEFGHVDRLVIVRNGQLAVDERFPRDYRAISTGKSSALGCGIDACTDSARAHHYNYLHPDYHPWWRGSAAHIAVGLEVRGGYRHRRSHAAGCYP